MVKLKYNGPYESIRINVLGVAYFWKINEIKDVCSEHSTILLKNGSFSMVEKVKSKVISRHKEEDKEEKKSTIEHVHSPVIVESKSEDTTDTSVKPEENKEKETNGDKQW